MSESQSPDRKKPDPLVGMDLGNYRISELIGEGGMGAVYAARHPVLGREVAVKVLSRMLCDDEDFLARFRQEALAANKVGHEVIVEATDFGTLPDGRRLHPWDEEGRPLGDEQVQGIAGGVGDSQGDRGGRQLGRIPGVDRRRAGQQVEPGEREKHQP